MKNAYPLAIVLILGLVAGHYFFSPKEVYIVHQCKIQNLGSCFIEKEGIGLRLSINPHPIIPTEDLNYQLETSGIEVEEVTIRLLGHDMEMPRDEQQFPLKSLLGNQRFEATRVFPTCTEKLMTWRIYLVIKAKNKWVRTTFNLAVKRPTT